LRECKFDRNSFGQFLGSASVVYEDAKDAAKAIEEYHGAYLDDKLLTVEYDTKNVVRVPKIRSANAISKSGKTLRVQQRRGGVTRAGRR
jgi:RNA recognition motif-containing protein